MARTPNFPPKVHHHASGRDRIRWRGVDYWLGPTGSAEAKRRYAAVVREIAEREADGGPAEPRRDDLSVGELAAWWDGRAPQLYRPTSPEPKQIGAAVAVFVELWAGEPVATLRPRHFRAVRDAMGRRWCRAVANRGFTRVKTVLRRAAEDDLVPAEVYAAARTVPAIPPGTPGVRESAGRRAATEAELAAVLAECPVPVAVLLAVTRLTGMRPAEARLMRARQVERRADGTAVYRRTPADGHKSAWLGRTKVVILGPLAMRVLSPWLHAAAAGGDDDYVFRPSDGPRTGGRRGPHYRCDSLGQAVRKAAARAGVAMTTYGLRHAFKLDALRQGDVAAVMACLGQTSSRAFDAYGREGASLAAEDLARKIG